MKIQLLLASLLLSTSAIASDVFVEFSIGPASTSAPDVVDSPFGYNLTRSIDDSDLGFSIKAGYMLTDKFSFALGYANFGQGEHIVEGDTITPEQFVASIEQAPLLAEGFTASVVFNAYKSEALSIDVEAGLFCWDADLFSSSQLGLSEQNIDGTDPFYGISASYTFTSNWQAVGSYHSYQLEEDISYPSIGVRYSF